MIGIMGIVYVSRNIKITIFSRRIHNFDADYFPLIDAPFIISRVPGETLMKEAAYKKKSRVIGWYFRNADSSSYFGSESLDHLHRTELSHHKIHISKEEVKRQAHLRNSKDYRHGARDELESGDCKAQHDWQKTSFPTCNLLHEHDLGLIRSNQVKVLGNGYWRDVWKVRDGAQEEQALKTIRYEHDFEDRNYDRHRRDALAMERLTASPNVVDIWAFCGNSGIFEFAPGGDIEDMLWYSDSKWNNTEKLIVSYQVVSGISDVHNVEGNGRPSIAHTDITTSQFVHSNGRYKLNDFNRCRFITWNEKENRQCGFYVGNNPGNFRSPEEYNYEMETEKIDIYSMGNVFYSILTEKWPYEDDKSRDAQEAVKQGKRPNISSRLQNSDDPAVKAILKAITMSWRHDPEERATALEVKEFLRQELKKLNLDSNDL
jgi:serine/threonine protein kinase